MTRKKNPVRYDYHLGHVDLQGVEKYLGVTITSKLTWETQVLMVSAEANKLLGLLRRTCPIFFFFFFFFNFFIELQTYRQNRKHAYDEGK